MEDGMNKFQKISFFLLAALLLAQPLLAGPQLIPHGSVKLLDSGAIVDQQMPVPAGMLMACSGQCYIEASGMQLMGSDKTVFAVHEESDRFSIMVQQGTVDFALKAETKPIEFTTPFDSISAKPYMVPASSDSVARGTLQVTENRAVLTMTQGSLELTNSDGHKLIHAGNSIVLAQATVEGGAAGAAGTTAGTAGATFSTAGLIVGGTAAAIIGGAVIDTESSKDSGSAVRPF
jgi:hypothetical protein